MELRRLRGARSLRHARDDFMTAHRFWSALLANDALNFLLTNRVPRRLLTHGIAWFSRIERPWVRDLSLAVWRLFAAPDLSDAKETSFKSMHDCFIRELAPGARIVDPDPTIVASPCDAIVGACGSLSGVDALQAKGSAYPLA